MTISTPVLTTPNDVLASNHIVWGDEAKPLVLIRELAALLNGCAPIPKIHWPFDFRYPLANFLWLMPQFVTAQLPR
jgi:hypothetical protein